MLSLTLSGLRGPDGQIHSCQSETSYPVMSMVAQCYQARFCNLNTIFILKIDSNSVLNNNFTFKLVLIFNSEVKINFNFNYKINSKVKMYF